MGKSISKISKRNEKLYIKKILTQRNQNMKENTTLTTAVLTCEQFKNKLFKYLYAVFDGSKKGEEKILYLLKIQIERLNRKDIVSTISYMAWEKDFINNFKSDEEHEGPDHDEIYQFSKVLLQKQKSSFFWKLAKKFDMAIFQEYGDDIVEIYKNVTFSGKKSHKVNHIFSKFRN